MKKISLLAVAGLLVSLCSCNNSEGTNSERNTDSLEAAASDATTVTETQGSLGPEDSEFVMKAANGGMAEVEMGKLAQDKASNSKTKEFGTMMVKDHSKANEELMALAQAKGISLPGELSVDARNKIQELSAKSGSEFDEAYLKEMVDDHKKDVVLFENAQENVKDPELKQFIDKTLPVLKMHLDHVEMIKK